MNDSSSNPAHAAPRWGFDSEADGTRAHLAAIVSSSEEAIVSKTLEGVVTSWNSAAERLFGFTSAEMVGQSIKRVIPPELHDEESAILARLRAGERIERYETTRVRKSGERVEVSLTISPVRDRNGTIVGAAKVAHDITLGGARNGR
ncbi:MAG: PAS domain S-box protein [Gammaproteobacteria bacterium]